ncbi:FAD-dependent oxidoreductase [Mycobacterium paraterrae]|uniref:FAD-dependent monooxygenase n=1 Tax=Mycobacterium paraterrae TaxID=577492 RepID=A0ABY3VT87_9MYCO|nr:FAD-dependent monooxygenase [Mycobacterium paraterrae]UMB70719.1 FAD-dependent monooxygenase [Mycobacterium paraterrae]
MRAGRAIVCGAGIGGLLAARVLSDFYDAVTIVERDKLSDGAVPRRGVRQGRHSHVLTSRGLQEFAMLFPGLREQLVAAGATVCDDGDLSRVSIRVAGREYNRSCTFADPESVVVYLLSRPLLEAVVRERVRRIGNVQFLDGHDVVEPVAMRPGRITGARLFDRKAGVERVLDADLVVDAMGRGARTPSFLDSLGYGRPTTEHSTANATYASQLLRIPAGVVNEKMTMVFPEPALPTGGALSSYEDNTWMLTVYRLDQLDPPADYAELIELATRFVSPALTEALRAGAEPLGQMDVFRYPGGAWRRYDQMPQFPDGLLVFGDAICSLSPIYTQGMTVAALQAVALRDCLAQSGLELSRRFFAAAAAVIGPQWTSNQFNDLYMYTSDDRPAVSEELLFLREEVLLAAESSSMLTEKLFRTMNLVDPPADYSPLLV